MVILRAAALALLIACASGGAASLGEPFQLKAGERIRVADLEIRFVEVASDSRCPPDVTCVWAGDAVVRLDVNGQKIELHTHTPKAAAVDGYTIEMKSLSRQPYVGEFVVRD